MKTITVTLEYSDDVSQDYVIEKLSGGHILGVTIPHQDFDFCAGGQLLACCHMGIQIDDNPVFLVLIQQDVGDHNYVVLGEYITGDKDLIPGKSMFFHLSSKNFALLHFSKMTKQISENGI